MRTHTIAVLLLSGLGTATQLGKIKHFEQKARLSVRDAPLPANRVGKIEHVEDQSHLLVKKDGYCSGTCASCFGAGNIICEGIMCYDPSAGEQCCADGTYCVGSDTSCCGSVGAGEGYDDSATTALDSTPTATDVESPTGTDLEPTSSYTSTVCADDDTPDQCCARLNPGAQWCSGDGSVLSYTCFDPSIEECCDDGTGNDGFRLTCEGEGCCQSDYAESAVTPTPTVTSGSGSSGGAILGGGSYDTTTDGFDASTGTFDLGGTTSTGGAVLGGGRTTTTSDSTTSSVLSGDPTPVSGGSGSGSGSNNLMSGSSSLSMSLGLGAAGVITLLGLVVVL